MRRTHWLVGAGSLVAAGAIGGVTAISLAGGHSAPAAIVQRSDATSSTTTTTAVAPTTTTTAQTQAPTTTVAVPTTTEAAPATTTTVAMATVPNVAGDTIDAANAAISATGLTPHEGANCPGATYALTQSPSAGTAVPPGTVVYYAC
jgi:PASTA domain